VPCDAGAASSVLGVVPRADRIQPSPVLPHSTLRPAAFIEKRQDCRRTPSASRYIRRPRYRPPAPFDASTLPISGRGTFGRVAVNPLKYSIYRCQSLLAKEDVASSSLVTHSLRVPSYPSSSSMPYSRSNPNFRSFSLPNWIVAAILFLPAPQNVHHQLPKSYNRSDTSISDSPWHLVHLTKELQRGGNGPRAAASRGVYLRPPIA